MIARDLFTKQHKDLAKEGERWMKETATSCTVVGALIITIMFAAVFTVPGSPRQDTGYPMFLDGKLFVLFTLILFKLYMWIDSTQIKDELNM